MNVLRRFVSAAFACVVICACSSSSSTVAPGTIAGGDDGGTTPPGGGDDGGTTPPPPPAPPGTPPPPPEVKITTESMMFGGRTRTYLLVVPLDYDAGKTYPLVLDFHGMPATGASQQATFPFEKASHDGALVVYPDGTNQQWDLYTAGSANVDMPWIPALVDALAAKYSVDKTRVLGTGYSNGAFFVNELACNYPGLLKAIAVHEGGAPDETNNPNATLENMYFWRCNGEVPTAAFVFQGTADTVVTPDSGDFDASYWAHINGCSDTRNPTTPSPCQEHASCPAGKRVTYCLIPGLTHLQWSQGDATAWAYFTAL